MIKFKKIILFIFCLSTFVAQEIDYNNLRFEEQFRIGVMRFNNKKYSESIIAFQKALSYKPDNSLANLWLGKAYYFSGYHDATINEWKKLINKEESNSYVENLINQLNIKKGILSKFIEDQDYVVLGEIKGKNDNDEVLFSRPTNIYPKGDGSFYITSVIDNNIYQIDQNGVILNKNNGSNAKALINKGSTKEVSFKKPFDIIKVNDKLYITEFENDDVVITDLNGDILSRFGAKGIEEGQFYGPQYLASDGAFLFITDLGNQRIQKFDLEGNFISYFGSNTNGFKGFNEPLGITYFKDKLAVADKTNQGNYIYIFDKYGNFIFSSNKSYSDDLNEMEDLFYYNEDGKDQILVSTKDKIFSYDIDNDRLNLLFKSKDDKSKFIASIFDDNNNLIVSEFINQKLILLNRKPLIYSGLYVQINNINSDNFPRMQVEFNITDVYDNPIINLDKSNFILTEDSVTVDKEIIYRTDTDNFNEISIILDSSSNILSKDKIGLLDSIINYIFDHLENSNLRILLTSKNNASFFEIDKKNLLNVLSSFNSSEQRDLSTAIRIGSKELFTKSKGKRSIIYIGDGTLDNNDFSTYGFIESALYLKSFSIGFYVLNIINDIYDDKLKYIADKTDGNYEYFLNINNLDSFINKIKSKKESRYIIQYNSTLNPGFGKRYIPLKIQTYLLSRSGRDELGYYAPLNLKE